MDASADLSSPFDAALADDGFVRALARRLTRASDAEDLAQDAWLAALRRRPDGGIRGWLAKALSHLAANRGRGDRRRRRREEIAARPEATASPERSLLEREEVRRKLIAAVVALGPPASTVLVLRFFEELSPKEIARRLEMPDATVRSHLKRGLSRLRERLADDRDARGRSALACLPLLLTPRDALAAALGVAAMTVQGKALVAAVVVACAVGVAVVARDDADPPRIAGVEAGAREAAPRPDDGTPAPARADAKIAAAPYVEESGEASEIPASAPVAPHDGCTLRGRVLDADGRPVAACDVVVSSKELCSVVFEERDLLDRLARGEPGYPPPLGAVGPPRVVRTDDEGRFAAEDLPASADAGVAAVSPRHGVATAVGVALKPGAAHDVALAFPPAVTVFGRVLDDEGRPIEGQSVFFMGGRGDGAMSSLIGARTDATGTYRTPPVARAELTAQVQRAGFKFAHRRIERIGPEERGRRVDFALERAPQLRGRLLAAGGGPARLKETLEARGLTERSFRPAVLGSWEDPATVANFLDIGRDRGAASLDDDSWTLSPNGDAPRFVSVWVGRALVASEESRGRLEFDLVVDATKLPAPPKRTPLHVRVVDAAGVPLPDSTVRLDRRFGAWIVELERVMPDPPAAPGLHVFPRLGPGAFTLEASAKGYASRLFDVVIGGGPAAAEATVVLARPAGAVDVLVRGPDGPLNRAAVALHDAEGRPLRSPTPANAEGRATFEGLAEGAYFVSATADGLAGAGRPVRVAAGRASVALQLSAGVAVSIDPEGSLGPFTFRYFDECGVPIHDGLAGGGRTYGDVETVRLPPGPVTVEVLCPDHEPARVAFDAKDGATVKVPLVRKGG